MRKEAFGGQDSGVRQFPDILNRKGFAFVPAPEMRAMLERAGSLADWDAFAVSWNDLKTDEYMADKGRYRKRRYAVYSATNNEIKREAHQPHFQTLDYNPLHGGVERWFAPMTDAVSNSESMQTILKCCVGLFGDLYQQEQVRSSPLEGEARWGGVTQSRNSEPRNAPFPAMPAHRTPSLEGRGTLPLSLRENSQIWHIETHQFRIEAKAGKHGQPTPEGMHRDGRDYVLVLMIRRDNIQSGVTTIHDLERKKIGSFTLTQAFDAALVDDRRVYHGVTAVAPLDPTQAAYRDVLVVTFKAE